MATLCLPDGRGEGGSCLTGDEGRVTAGVVTLEPGPMSRSDMRFSRGDEAPDIVMLVVIF